MEPVEKIIQISAIPETQYTVEVLYALTDFGSIYIRVDDKWEKIELPDEQEQRLKKEKEEKDKNPKKGWFS